MNRVHQRCGWSAIQVLLALELSLLWPVSVATISPFQVDNRIVATVQYDIAVNNGNVQTIPQSNYTTDLIQAMEEVVNDVKLQLVTKTQLANLSSSQARVSTNVSRTVPLTCPAGVSTNNACLAVTTTVEITSNTIVNQTNVAEQLVNGFYVAIDDGKLQSLLLQINPQSVVRILKSTIPTASVPAAASPYGEAYGSSSPPVPSLVDEPVTSETLSPVNIASFVICSAVVILIPLAIYLFRTQPDPDSVHVNSDNSSDQSVAKKEMECCSNA